MVEVGGDAALVESSTFLDLLVQLVEQAVVFETAHDLFLVVEGNVARDRARQAPRGFFGFDEGHREGSERKRYRPRLRAVNRSSQGGIPTYIRPRPTSYRALRKPLT